MHHMPTYWTFKYVLISVTYCAKINVNVLVKTNLKEIRVCWMYSGQFIQHFHFMSDLLTGFEIDLALDLT